MKYHFAGINSISLLKIAEKQLIYKAGERRMSEKIFNIENQQGPFQTIFQRMMRLVPEKDKSDKKLQRLIAFRLKIDGEAAAGEYLIRKIRQVIQCGYTGSFYEFIKDDLKNNECGFDNNHSDPPGAA
jgi:hypothetical protein